ncbi:MAG: hypothetical protein GTO62_05195, partial [Planctomycetales bacterium]|nr:hypothetical protein [Planctomycetales bacterium]
DRRLAESHALANVASHTLAVVPLADGIEAVVVLDPVRSTLSGYVLDRSTGNFFVRYSYGQLLRDFELTTNDAPQFTIVGGSPTFRGFTGNVRLANAAIYVAEKKSGKLAAYGFKWNTTYRANPPQGRQLPFVPLDAANFRFPAPGR